MKVFNFIIDSIHLLFYLNFIKDLEYIIVLKMTTRPQISLILVVTYLLKHMLTANYKSYIISIYTIWQLTTVIGEKG